MIRLAASACLALALAACADLEPSTGPAIPGADPARGHALIVAYGCGTCHVVPGVRGARGRVGPSLEAWSARALIAGIIGNTPPNLVAWLLDPVAISPRTGMPALGLDEAQARDIATYLYTLGRDQSRAAVPESGLNPAEMPRPLLGRGPFVGG